MPFWLYFWAFVYAGTSLALIRSYAEHRAEDEVERRTAIVEDSWLLGPLFLFNNLHVVHHMRAEPAVVRDPALVSAEPRGGDRAQRRAGLPQLFRRRAALSVHAAP